MAGSLAVLMDLHAPEILYCTAGAGLPDQMEKIGKHRIIGHRTLTHEFFLWLAPLLLSFSLPQIVPGTLDIPLGPSPNDYLFIRTWVLFLPGLFHLGGDVLTPAGVPVAGRKVSLGLFKTGQPTEYVVAGLFVLAATLYKTGFVI